MRKLNYASKVFLLLLPFLLSVVFVPFAKAEETSNLAVTATIPPRPVDFQASLSSPTTVSPVPQNTIVQYRIAYGSLLQTSSSFTLEASWDLGTLAGSSTPSVDIVGYVLGSASNGYGSVEPVVDNVNNKISWTFHSFPSNSIDNIVQFSLVANRNFKGSRSVTFPVSAKIVGYNMQTPKSSVTKTYKYLPGLTPTESSDKLVFNEISVRELSDKDAMIFISTSKEAIYKIEYGIWNGGLVRTVLSKERKFSANLKLENLDSNKKYSYKVTATDIDGNPLSSDYFIFTTAIAELSHEVDRYSTSLSVSNIDLVGSQNRNSATKGNVLIVAPINQILDFRFDIGNSSTVKKVQIVIRNKNVLGISTQLADEENPSSDLVNAVEIVTGHYLGRLRLPSEVGTYGLIARSIDYKGNIQESTISDLRIIDKFKVINSLTNASVEGAQILFYYYNGRLGTYELLPPETLSIINPSYSDNNGDVDIALPQGKYKAVVRSIGFKEKEVFFSIGELPKHRYPLVTLEAGQFGVVTFAIYYGTIIEDFLRHMKLSIRAISQSNRFFELNALITSFLLIFITLLAFSSRLRIPLRSLLEFIIHRGKIMSVKQDLGNKIHGRIFDHKSSDSVARADIFLINSEVNKVVDHTTTNANGCFAFDKLGTIKYELEIMKPGYEPIIYHESEIQAVEPDGYSLSIKKNLTGVAPAEKIKIIMRRFIALSFESLLLSSLVFELSLGYALGWIKILPFLIFSIVNLLIWMFNLSYRRSAKNTF